MAEINPQVLAMKQYVDDIFLERVQAEGFKSLDENHLQWYRVVGEDIVQSMFFHRGFSTAGGAKDIWTSLGYAIHPMHIRPVYLPTRTVATRPTRSFMIFRQAELVEPGEPWEQSRGPYLPGKNHVRCPIYGTRGRYTFDGILLPLFDKIQTEEQCYQFHKEKIWFKTNLGCQWCRDFYADEPTQILYMQDEERYDYCRRYIEGKLNENKEWPVAESTRKKRAPEVAWLQVLWNTLETGDRTAFLEGLACRKEKYKKELIKKVGLSL